MNSDRLRAYCCRCQHVQVFRRIIPAHRWHLVLTVLTGGLWLVSWISVIIITRIQPWRCRRCDWILPRADALTARTSRANRAKSRTDEDTSTPTAP